MTPRAHIAFAFHRLRHVTVSISSAFMSFRFHFDTIVGVPPGGLNLLLTPFAGLLVLF